MALANSIDIQEEFTLFLHFSCSLDSVTTQGGYVHMKPILSLALSLAAVAVPVATFAHGAPKAVQATSGHKKSGSTAEKSTPLVSLNGTLKQGSQSFTLVGSTSHTLRFGPPWFMKGNPLANYANHAVQIVGHSSGHAVHVVSVNGKVLHGHGKPPWAGHNPHRHGK